VISKGEEGKGEWASLTHKFLLKSCTGTLLTLRLRLLYMARTLSDFRNVRR